MLKFRPLELQPLKKSPGNGEVLEGLAQETQLDCKVKGELVGPETTSARREQNAEMPHACSACVRRSAVITDIRSTMTLRSPC